MTDVTATVSFTVTATVHGKMVQDDVGFRGSEMVYVDDIKIDWPADVDGFPLLGDLPVSDLIADAALLLRDDEWEPEE